MSLLKQLKVYFCFNFTITLQGRSSCCIEASIARCHKVGDPPCHLLDWLNWLVMIVCACAHMGACAHAYVHVREHVVIFLQLNGDLNFFFLVDYKMKSSIYDM